MNWAVRKLFGSRGTQRHHREGGNKRPLRYEQLEGRLLLASFIRSPVGVLQNTAGDYAPSYSIAKTVDRSGLSSSFTSGITDFDAYLANNPTHTVVAPEFEWFAPRGVRSSKIVYDMGAEYPLDRMAMWNEESSGISAMVVSTSNDPTFATFTHVGTFSPKDNPYSPLMPYRAEVFDILNTTARYVRLEVTGPQAPFTYDGVAMGEIAFATPGPDVEIKINGTAEETDDITLYNQAPSIQAFTQTIQAIVTNKGGEGTFELVAEPAGRVSLNKTQFNLKNGQSETIVITPMATSASANDVVIRAKVGSTVVGAEDMTVVSVVLPQHIRRNNTPKSMPDRVPPRVETPFSVQVTPNLGSSGQRVRLAVLNQNDINGTVTINGSLTADVFTFGNVSFRGVSQTAPGGNSSKLQLVAQVRGENTIRSQGFSISAIPVNFRRTGVQLLAGGVLQFDYTWNSDSGNLADLDQVWVGQYVSYSDRGIHVGPGRPWLGNDPDPDILPSRGTPRATSGVIRETLRPPGNQLPSAGPADSFTATQRYGFHDFRTDNREVDNSLSWQINLLGPIVISRFVENIGTASAPVWRYRITKSGFTNTAGLGS